MLKNLGELMRDVATRSQLSAAMIGLLSIAMMLLVGISSPAAASEDSSSIDRQQIDRSGANVQKSLWPRASSQPFGLWSKLAGTVKDLGDQPLGGETVYLQRWDGSTWRWLSTVTTNSTGYFQKWFYTESSPRTYRARYAGDDTLSNETTITLSNNISAWNNYRPKVRYCQWTKIHGKYGGPNGIYPNTTLYLQRKSGSSWVWQATVRTNSSGYYAAWAPVVPTTSFRMATWGSAVVSAPVIKTGSTLTVWANSKVHAVLRDGYGDPVGSKTVYLQKWSGSSWGWVASGITSSTGYVGFTPSSTGSHRMVWPLLYLCILLSVEWSVIPAYGA